MKMILFQPFFAQKECGFAKNLKKENKNLKIQLEELIWSHENELAEKERFMDDRIRTLENLLEESHDENERLSEELLDLRDFEIERSLSAELGKIDKSPDFERVIEPVSG